MYGNKDEEPRAIRLLVLEAEEPHPEIQDRRGRYHDMFHELFSNAGARENPPIKVKSDARYIVEEENPLPTMEEMREKYDGVVISGSNYDAHGNNEWILKLVSWLQEMWKVNPQIRLSGVCFGHQINCRALGSKVAVSPENWELSHTTINLSPIGQKLFSLPKSEKTIALHQMHQDHVEDPPHHSKSPTGCLKPEDQVHIWGSSDNCPIQGIFVPRRLFTTQGHLGYDEHMVKKELEQREESGSIDTEAEKEKVEEAKDKADLHHDGEVVAGVILRFFAGRDD